MIKKHERQQGRHTPNDHNRQPVTGGGRQLHLWSQLGENAPNKKSLLSAPQEIHTCSGPLLQLKLKYSSSACVDVTRDYCFYC